MKCLKLFPLLISACIFLTACENFGKVEQGRTIAFDKTNKEVTILKDISENPDNPDYTGLPPIRFYLPKSPEETGAEPTAGLCVRIDLAAKTVTMFNLKTQSLETLPFELIDEHRGVDINKKHVLVFDPATNRPRAFPQVNADERKVTIYDKKEKLLVTIQLDDKYFSQFHPEDWQFGDEVRSYFKDPGQSLRFMNITKTDIFKR